MAQLIVNWITTPNSVALKEGQIMKIKVLGVDWFAWVILKDGFPVLVGQTSPGDNDDTKIILRKGMSLKGPAQLRVKGYDKGYRGFGFRKDFIII